MLRQVIGLTHDLLRGSWHGSHLRYLGRASIAGNDANLKHAPRSVGSDQHEQLLIELFDSNRIVVCVEDVLDADAMLVGTLGDDRIAFHLDKIACIGANCKLPCTQQRSRRTKRLYWEISMGIQAGPRGPASSIVISGAFPPRQGPLRDAASLRSSLAFGVLDPSRPLAERSSAVNGARRRISDHKQTTSHREMVVNAVHQQSAAVPSARSSSRSTSSKR